MVQDFVNETGQNIEILLRVADEPEMWKVNSTAKGWIVQKLFGISLIRHKREGFETYMPNTGVLISP